MASSEAGEVKGKLCAECGSLTDQESPACTKHGKELMLDNEDPLIGSVLAEKYEIISRLGAGGMSVVYKARHKLMDRLVAIKMLHARLVKDQATIMRFQQEAKALSRLNHPNLVTAFDFGLLSEGQPYLVMDFVEGESLEELLDKNGPQSADWCVALTMQVCRALAHAHQMGVLHRDLKPGNIILARTPKGSTVAKVVDFGLATFLPESGVAFQKLTNVNEVPGSPLYMSPEQCRGRELDLRSDIYSLGCVMHEVLTGLPPFVGADWMETMQKQVYETPAPLCSTLPILEIPCRLEEIVLKCLTKDPGERYQSMEQLRLDLEAARAPAKMTPSVMLPIPKELAEKEKALSLMVVEDLESQREHVVKLIKEKVPGPLQIHEATNGLEALKLFEQVHPDMIVSDISMPEMNGIKMAQQIWSKSPQTKILFWSQYHREAYVRELGKIVPDEAIHGYALKTASDDKLAYAILSVLMYDNPYIDPVVRAVQKRLQTQEQPLSDEEYDTLIDLALGLTDRAIATRRHISIRGVQNRIQALQAKLLHDMSGHEAAYDLRNRIVLEGLKRGMIDCDEVQEQDKELYEWLEDEFDYEHDDS
ncbi:MAG: protein kinase [Candidatus Melainabacteria bacterium]|nr:protein kinase [Candidatus Melainabacteria bacterium]